MWALGKNPILPTPWNNWLLLFSSMVLISLWATYDISVSLPKVTGVVLGLAIYYGFYRYARSQRGWLVCWLIFIGGGLAVTVLSLLGTNWAETKFQAMNALTSRMPAVLKLAGAEEGIHPNEVAGALLWVLPSMAVVWFLVTSSLVSLQKIWPRWLVWSLWAGLSIVGSIEVGIFILTQSRSAYFGLAAAALIMLGFVLPHRWLKIYAIIGGAGLLLGLGLFFSKGIEPGLRWILGLQTPNTTAFSIDTVEARTELWSRALYCIQAFPITGMGMNTFRYLVNDLFPLKTIDPGYNFGHAHNEYLQTALDLGLPGLISLIGIYLSSLVMAVRSAPILKKGNLSVENPRKGLFLWDGRLLLGLGWGLLGHMVYGLFDAIALGAKPGFLFWMALGLMAAGLDRVNHPTK